jgi:hypothetical protein
MDQKNTLVFPLDDDVPRKESGKLDHLVFLDQYSVSMDAMTAHTQ